MKPHRRGDPPIAPARKPRTNTDITAPQLRVIDSDGTQLGILSRRDALQVVEAAGLDLVEVAAGATPPVARIQDAAKVAYAASLKERAARRNQRRDRTREMKFRPQIGDHDYLTKRHHLERFLNAGDKVRVTVMFKGRQQSHPQLGQDLLDRLRDDLAGIADIDTAATMNGRDMRMTFAPHHKA